MTESDLLEREDAGSEARFEAFFRHLPVALYRTSPTGVLVDVNRKFVDVLGFASREEALGRDVRDLYRRPNDPHRLRTLLARTGTVDDFPAELRRKDGTPIQARLSVREGRDEDDELQHYDGALVDVTAQVEAEERLRTLVEAAPDGILTLSDDHKIDSVNRRTAELFGYGEEELTGCPLELLLPPGTGPHHREHVDAFSEADQGTRTMAERRPVRGVRKDGTEFPLEVTISRTIRSGRPLFIAFIRDLSRRLAWEERIASMKRASALQTLAGGLAHHLNNLLTVVKGEAEILHQMQGEHPEVREGGQAILAAAHQAAQITHQILSFAGARVHRRELVELGEWLREVEEGLKAEVPPRVELRVVPPPDPLYVTLDRAGLSDVLAGLVENAVDAIPDGGTVVVEGTAAVQGEEDGGRRYASITVTDTGSGMPPDVLSRAFEPFYTTKELRQAPGLGLAAARGFITQLGGTLELESQEGEGTTVRILLPLSEPPDDGSGTAPS